jgi:hypothetical protein
MSKDATQFRSGELNAPGAASKGFTFYPDAPTYAQSVGSIGLDLFLIFAVLFTLYALYKRLAALAKRGLSTPSARKSSTPLHVAGGVDATTSAEQTQH